MLKRPTLDDLREEGDPGCFERERLELAAPRMHAALLMIRDWLDGKPTPKGRIKGHGTAELRAVVEAAIGTKR